MPTKPLDQWTISISRPWTCFFLQLFEMHLTFLLKMIRSEIVLAVMLGDRELSWRGDLWKQVHDSLLLLWRILTFQALRCQSMEPITGIHMPLTVIYLMRLKLGCQYTIRLSQR